MSDLPQIKASLRKRLKKSASISQKERFELSHALVTRLHQLIANRFPELTKIATFAGLANEPDLLSLTTTLPSKYQFYYPKVTGDHSMDFFQVRDTKCLRKGAFGILEPTTSCPVIPPEEIELILCPGEAFSRLGHRLGKGGGFYDRYFPQTKSVRIGICFENRLIENLPREAHDTQMNFVVTQNEVFEVH